MLIFQTSMIVGITHVLMADCVWMVSILIRVIALLVILAYAVCLVGKRVDLSLVKATRCSLREICFKAMKFAYLLIDGKC